MGESGNGQTTAEAKAEAFEYWPSRWVTTVRDETLEVWREQLLRKIAAAEEGLRTLRGGVAQLDAECERRKARRKANVSG